MLGLQRNFGPSSYLVIPALDLGPAQFPDGIQSFLIYAFAGIAVTESKFRCRNYVLIDKGREKICLI